MESQSRVQNQSSAEPRSESKVLVGQKRDIVEAEETSESSHKRLKLIDLDSACPSKAKDGIERQNTVHPDVNSDSRAIDLNVTVGTVSIMVGVDSPACIEESNRLLNSAKEEKARGLDFDLNAEDMSSSINHDTFYPFKNYEHLKSRDDSECGSSMGSLDEKDSMRVWEGLKKNNYMSTPYEATPMQIPKSRGRKKNNNDVMKKKIELAKKEQVDRFARVAAPSGLLSGLNPGIINHVRNSKQVHSIIEALMRSKSTEKKHSGSSQREEPVDVHSSGVNRFGPSHGGVLSERRQIRDYALFAESNYLDSEVARRMPSHCNRENKDDGLALKLSSSVTVASENTSCLSNEESGNLASVTSLSFKAANVASQWLELLNQDIRGRLAALRRSKKRVRAVITTELPLLISREFSSNLEKDTQMTNNASADAHAVRWNTLFGQMEKALSDEESHLENWLNQVKEMQLHCERGLYNSLPNTSQESGPMGNNNRLGEAHNTEKDLAVRAAAAAIYSTCNYLLTMENGPSG